MKTLGALPECGKGGGAQLRTRPQQRGEEDGRKQGCTVRFGACFSVLILTLVKAGALQLL